MIGLGIAGQGLADFGDHGFEDVEDCARVVSLDLRVVSISIAPAPLIVPAKTSDADPTWAGRSRAVAASGTGCLSTGMLSPVTGA